MAKLTIPGFEITLTAAELVQAQAALSARAPALPGDKSTLEERVSSALEAVVLGWIGGYAGRAQEIAARKAWMDKHPARMAAAADAAAKVGVQASTAKASAK